jgi:insulysin
MTASTTCAAGSIRVPNTTKALHRFAVLANGVTVITVEDPSCNMASAAMTIKAGSLCDPVEFPGLAHFTEHMLFMGTNKFPIEDEYDKFVTSNGGHSNAWTADMATTYYFTIAGPALFGGLERFVEFFAAPMFSESCVEREVQAVHSEDEKNHSVDYWRLDEIFRSMYSPCHPRFRYGNGNAKTLWTDPRAKGLDVRAALVNFYEQHYVAPAACIAVYSKHTLEEIVQMVEPALLRMRPAPAAPSFSFLPALRTPFANTTFGNVYCVKSVKKVITVRIVWSLKQSVDTRIASQPSVYASHVLGHECNASVLAALKAENLATSLSCGARAIDDDFEMFYIDVGLTKTGFGQVSRVVDTIFEGVAVLLRTGSVDDSTFSQMLKEENLSFELDDMKQPSSHCAALSGNALIYGPEKAWVGPMLISKEDRAAAFEVIGRELVPSNCFLVFLWSEFETGECEASVDQSQESSEDGEDDSQAVEDEPLSVSMLPAYFDVTTWQTAPIHNSRFTVGAIPREVMQRWEGILDGSIDGPHRSRLGLPPANPYLATDFTVHRRASEDPEPEPVKIVTVYGTFFVKADPGRHNVPKIGVKLETVSAVPYASPLHRFFARVAVLILKDQLTEMLYCAELASIAIDIEMSEGGIALAVEGPSQKVLEMCVELLDQCVTLDVLMQSSEKFLSYRDLAIRTLDSARMSQPYELAATIVRHEVFAVHYTFEEVLEAARAAEGASLDAYVAFLKAFLASPLGLEGTIFGNIQSTQEIEQGFCAALTNVLEKRQIPPMTAAAAEAIPRYRDTFLMSAAPAAGPPDSWLAVDHEAFNDRDPNTAVIATFALGEESATVRALSEVLAKLLQSEFFSALRTTESVGYIVASSAQRIGYCALMKFVVQSAVPALDCGYLLTRIIAFLDYVEHTMLPAWTLDQLDSIKGALIRQRQDPPKSIREELSRLDDEVLHPLQFRRRSMEIEAIRSVNLAAVRDFFFEHLSNAAGGEKRRLAVFVRRAGAAPLLEPKGSDVLRLTTRALVRERSESTTEQPIDIKLPTFEDEVTRRVLTIAPYSRERHALQSGVTLRDRSF